MPLNMDRHADTVRKPTGIELTLRIVTCVGQKLTSPLARALLNAVLTNSGRFGGTFTGAILHWRGRRKSAGGCRKKRVAIAS